MNKIDDEAAAKKVPGEAHWRPARRTAHGLVVIDGGKYRTPRAAKAEARSILAFNETAARKGQPNE